MQVTQIAEIMNDVTKEILGEQAIAEQDLTNIVDAGRAALNASDVEKFTSTLMDRIGKTIFVNRPYEGSAPSVLMDGTLWGSIVQKISTDIPDAEDNPTWNLVDGQTYNQDIFTAPEVQQKLWNSKRTLQVKRSTVDTQLYSAFDGQDQLSAFISMLFDYAQTSLTIKLDGLIRFTIAGMIADTLYNYNSSGTYTGAGNTRAINLLKRYNDAHGTSLTAAQAILTPDFIRYAAYQIGLVKRRMGDVSRLFNVGGTAKYTSNDRMHTVFLSEFYDAASVYLQSYTFHDEMVRFPRAETVNFWQGSGTNYSFSSTSAIHVKSPSNHSLAIDGVLAVLFDRDALGVANMRRYSTTHYNASAEFLNTWFKMDVMPWQDLNENFVVFYVK